jgi:ComF family protein
MGLVNDLKEALVHLFFPQICPGCQSDLVNSQQLICSDCMSTLPFTGFPEIPGNPVEKLFWGRSLIKHASSIFYFISDTPLQQIIHHIKYKNNPALGIYMGSLMGTALKKIYSKEKIDLMIPMPLHPKKQYERGYNQASLLCKGISETLNIPYREDLLLRQFNTDTQTKKSRIERWENIADAFELHEATCMQDKHILLIDDVITTGASTDACAEILLQKKAASVSICSLAYTI